MSGLRRTLIAGALAAAALAATAGSAAAAANPYTPVQICGPSYSVAQSTPLMSNHGGNQLGQVYLLYSLETGKSCGVTLKVRQIGVSSFTSVSIARYAKTPNWKNDGDYYQYYAGPRYVDGVPSCVRVGGYMKIPQGREGIYVEPAWERCP